MTRVLIHKLYLWINQEPDAGTTGTMPIIRWPSATFNYH